MVFLLFTALLATERSVNEIPLCIFLNGFARHHHPKHVDWVSLKFATLRKQHNSASLRNIFATIL